MFQRILAPVDFSEPSALGLKWASLLATKLRAVLDVLYVHTFSAPPYFARERLAELARQHRASLAEAAEHLERFVREALGAEASLAATHVREGLPADAVLEFAASRAGDLLVTGTHGRSGFNRWTMGSVAERLLRASPIPMLTVRGGAEAAPKIRSIVCPVNASPIAESAVRQAAALAEAFDASLHAVHVEESGDSQAIANLEEWLRGRCGLHCRLHETRVQGDAAEEILKMSRLVACDLLVIGARHRAFVDTTVIGATTVRVVRHAGCPVLTFMERREG